MISAKPTENLAGITIEGDDELEKLFKLRVSESLEPVGSKTGVPSSVQNREMKDGGIIGSKMHTIVSTKKPKKTKNGQQNIDQ